MNFIVRGIRFDDTDQVMSLARQFSLLNLPADKKVISQKIERSIASFNGDIAKEESTFVFVAEDLEQQWVCGSSQLVAKHGTVGEPSYSFQVLKKERFSQALGVGFIHQILRLKINEDGPTEVGGLVVDGSYRSRPEKVGKTTSLARFLYIAMNRDKFEQELYSQMAPPLTDEGRSEFWEALGRRFTGMPYKEADLLSQQNREFIRSLFPEEDIYLCLLDSKARLVMGKVAHETQPALHLLEGIGFKYNNEVDPFDGGPHLSCRTEDVRLIQNAKEYKVSSKQDGSFTESGLIGLYRDEEFFAGSTAAQIDGGEIMLPEGTIKALDLSSGEKINFTKLN